MIREVIEKDLEKVNSLCMSILGDSYVTIGRLGGLTNHTYHVTMEDGSQFVVRIPGEGTEELIVRKNEEISTRLACDLEIDAELLYFGEDGAKVTKYIDNAITMSVCELQKGEHIKQIAEILKRLHTCKVETGVPFDVFDMAAEYEKIIIAKNVPMYDDYSIIKTTVMQIKSKIDRLCDTSKVPCHNDPLCENWVTEGNGRMYLIDWEYAGMNDGMWDLADVSIEAEFDYWMDKELLKEYFGEEASELQWQHFYACKVYVDFLWTLWAKARVPYDGQIMEEWASQRYERLKKNIEQLVKV